MNTVVPGFVTTGCLPPALRRRRVAAAIAASCPAGPDGHPQDVADACQFLASPRASYISGSSLTLHGGGEPPAFLSAAVPAMHEGPASPGP